MHKKLVGAKAFIVPNRAITVGDWFAKSYNESAKKICKLNNVNPKDEKMVQVWIYHPDGGDESNWGDHHIDCKSIDDDGGWRLDNSVLPYDLLKGHVEGDTIQVILPATRLLLRDPMVEGSKVYESKNFKIELTLQQTGGRYSRFGKFEDVLAKVVY